MAGNKVASIQEKEKKGVSGTAVTYLSLEQPALARKMLLLIAKESIEAEKVYQQFLKKFKEKKQKEEEFRSVVDGIKIELSELLKSLPKLPSPSKAKMRKKKFNPAKKLEKRKEQYSRLDELERQIKELEKRIESL